MAITAYPLSYYDAVRLVHFEHKRYYTDSPYQRAVKYQGLMGCGPWFTNAQKLLAYIRKQESELVCYDGSKLRFSSHWQCWTYYQY